MTGFTMRDPTAETTSEQRNRIPPKVDLVNATIGLLCEGRPLAWRLGCLNLDLQLWVFNY